MQNTAGARACFSRVNSAGYFMHRKRWHRSSGKVKPFSFVRISLQKIVIGVLQKALTDACCHDKFAKSNEQCEQICGIVQLLQSAVAAAHLVPLADKDG